VTMRNIAHSSTRYAYVSPAFLVAIAFAATAGKCYRVNPMPDENAVQVLVGTVRPLLHLRFE
jgi:hypothetical protein